MQGAQRSLRTLIWFKEVILGLSEIFYPSKYLGARVKSTFLNIRVVKNINLDQDFFSTDFICLVSDPTNVR